MSLWSRLRGRLQPAAPKSPPQDDLRSAPASDEETPARDGRISAHDPGTATGRITLDDGSALPFTDAACAGFTPLTGARVQLRGVGRAAAAEPGAGAGALLATRLVLRPGSESEYAALLRVQQVARSLGQADAGRGLPPWLRPRGPGAPDGRPRRPAGPPRPRDAYFAYTVLLTRPLPEDSAALAALLRGDALAAPQARLIPLVDSRGRGPEAGRDQPEPGYSAEIRDGERRAFLVYRPEPYAAEPAAATDQGLVTGHVGLFLGFPATDPAQGAGRAADEGLLWELAAALLRCDPSSPGLIDNRGGRRLIPRAAVLAPAAAAT